MEHYSFHVVGEQEWPQVRSLRLAMLAESATAFGSAADVPRALDAYRWRDRWPGSLAWHAVAAGEPIGSLTLTVDPDDPTAAELNSVWVAPEHRGRRVATQLVRTAVQAWAEGGGTALVLWVKTANVPARRLYESEGFVPTAALRTTDGGQERQYARAL